MRRKSLDRIQVGDVIEKGYDRDGEVVLRSFAVNSDSDIEQLQRIGVHDALVDPADEEPALDSSDERPLAEAEWIFDEENLANMTDGLSKARALYEKTLDTLCTFFNQANQGEYEREQLAQLIALIGSFHEQIKDSPASVSMLTQIRKYDEVTYHHCLHVGLLALLYGEHVNFTSNRTRQLALAGLLHDIGKMRVPSEILQKPDSLEPGEWKQIQKHPEVGAEMLDIFELNDPIYRVVEEHHYLSDSGYPETVDGLHQFSRIIAVIDSYEAMVAYRPYQDPFSTLETFRQMQMEFGENEQVRPILFRLIQSLGLYPVGTFVQLNDGEFSFVQANHPDAPKRPTVLLLTDPAGAVLDTPQTLNLKRIEGKPAIVNGKMYDEDTSIRALHSFQDVPLTSKQFRQCIDKRL